MVAIIDYGAGNIRSLANALDYLDQRFFISNKLGKLQTADHLILPGVGSFKYGMDRLRKLNLDSFLKATKKPLLGICLGMQLLAQDGDEGGYSEGLGLIAGHVKKLPQPHVGWDTWEDKDYYFVHHYAIEDRQWAFKNHGNIWACQFHPEKSQEAGLTFLKEFCES